MALAPALARGTAVSHADASPNAVAPRNVSRKRTVMLKTVVPNHQRMTSDCTTTMVAATLAPLRLPGHRHWHTVRPRATPPAARGPSPRQARRRHQRYPSPRLRRRTMTGAGRPRRSCGRATHATRSRESAAWSSPWASRSSAWVPACPSGKTRSTAGSYSGARPLATVGAGAGGAGEWSLGTRIGD